MLKLDKTTSTGNAGKSQNGMAKQSSKEIQERKKKEFQS